MLKWLVSIGADIYMRNNEGETALLCAIDSGKFDCVKFLIEGTAHISILI